MKRISVIANDPMLVDAIATVLEAELGPDVLQLTYHLPRNAYQSLRDHRSMLIVIDEGGSDFEFPKASDSFANSPLLVIQADLKTMNIDIQKSYQMLNPSADEITWLVRDFRMSYLGNIDGVISTWAT